MTRKIKLRAWDKEGEHFAAVTEDSDFTLNWNTDGSLYLVNNGNPSEEKYELSQWTGLIDKNGKEIYEGDIVFKFGIDDAPYEVKYGEQKISHDWLGVGFYTEHKGEPENIYGGEGIEIIGNIYENPELIKNQNENKTI